MFSQSSMIQIVFLNENDVYYGSDLLKLDEKRYLWFELHEKFSNVYFIDFKEKLPDVFHYDETGTEDYKEKLFGKKEQNLLRWMKKKIKERKETCAFVCPMDSFCDYMKGEEKLLREFAQMRDDRDIGGTIVLTVSPVIEKSRELLLYHSFFEYINEEAVLELRRQTKIENMYSLLKSSKQESCVFLNVYTKERIRALLINLVFEYPDRYQNEKILGCIADYLFEYMNSPYLQMSERKLFKKDFSLVNPMFKDVYSQLKEKDVWKQLVERSKDYYQKLRDYLGEEYVDENMVNLHLSHSSDTALLRCMKLCSAGGYYGKYDNDMIRTLSRIYRKSVSPGNRTENKYIENCIKDFLVRLNNAKERKDSGTCKRILSSLLFCVQWIYVSEDKTDRIGKIIESYQYYEKCSSDYFELKKNYHPESFASENLAKKINNYEIMLESLDKVILTHTLNLTLKDNDESMATVLWNMQEIIDNFEDRNKTSAPGKKIKQKVTLDDIAMLADPGVPRIDY